jgi:acetyl-CoA/propionyl-CoA carboxylase biotin carboxyl carrier protein
VTDRRRFEKVLVANRGEIALRVFRALRELGIGCVGVYSEADRDALHVHRADEAYLLGPGTPAESYLHVERVIAAARRAGADAIHPGYGFLAENAGFAQRCLDEGIAWIGPPPAAIEAMGSKIRARQVMSEAGVPIVPGTTERVTTVGRVLDLGAEYGWPIALKAAHGGGGRGLRAVRGPDDAERALEAAQREGQAYFGDPAVYVERYLEDPRHIEVQVMADAHGAIVSLGERDCTLQRRHQKIVEETPSPVVSPVLRGHLDELGVAAARAVGYVGAGTIECLMDRFGDVFFLEMNTRIQVEHTITEAVTGIDLVREQVRVAMGEPLSFGPEDVVLRGHAIECRINAEDATAGYRPSPGRVTRYREPSGPGVRVDSALAEGGEVVALYDPMVAKVIVWDRDRDAARARMRRALDEMVVEGVRTLIPLHRLIMESPEFARGDTCAGFVEDVWPRQLQELEAGEEGGGAAPGDGRTRTRTYVAEVDGKRFEVVVHAPEPAALTEVRERLAARGSAHTAHGPGAVASPMHGTVVAVHVTDGQPVEQDEVLFVVEAMKMENEILAPRGGVVRAVSVAAGEAVSAGKLLCRIVGAD